MCCNICRKICVWMFVTRPLTGSKAIVNWVWLCNWYMWCWGLRSSRESWQSSFAWPVSSIRFALCFYPKWTYNAWECWPKACRGGVCSGIFRTTLLLAIQALSLRSFMPTIADTRTTCLPLVPPPVLSLSERLARSCSCRAVCWIVHRKCSFWWTWTWAWHGHFLQVTMGTFLAPNDPMSACSGRNS